MKSARNFLTALFLVAMYAMPSTAQVLITPSDVFFTGTAAEFFTDELHLIDGSGLSEPLDADLTNLTTVTHGNASQAAAWVTDAPNGGTGDYYQVGGNGGTVEFEFTLDGIESIEQIAYWGYGFGGTNGNSVSSMQLEFSTNGGATYNSTQTVPVPLAFGPASIVDLTPVDADFIRLTVLDNHFGVAGGGDRVGLAEIRFTAGDIPGIVSLEINRDTGAITIRNDSNNAIDIAGLGVTSPAGALDPSNWLSVTNNYDEGAGGAQNVSADAWIITSATSGDLSEVTLGIGSIGAGDTVDLGTGTWLQGTNEDLVFEYLDAITGEVVIPQVNFVGNSDAAFEVGDLNFDGSIDAADWPTYRDGYREDLSALSAAQAYQMGDLNGDGENNAVDFGIFRDAYEANNPGSFADMVAASSVPEPSTWIILMIGLACAGFLRFGKKAAVASVVVTFAVCLLQAPVEAALPTLVSNYTLDTDASDSVGTNNGTDTNVLYGGAGANANTGTSANFDGSTSTIDVPFSTDLNPSSFTVSLWALADTTSAPHQSAITSRDDAPGSTHGYILYNAPSGNWEFWTGDGDPGWDNQNGGAVTTSVWTHLAISFDADNGLKSVYINGALTASTTTHQYSSNGVEMENFHIGSGADDGASFFFTGDIDDVGVYNGVLTATEIQNVADNGVAAFAVLRLELEVNTATGAATLVNSAGAALDVNQYEILSAGGSLSTAGWDSIEDNGQNGMPQGTGSGDGWEELGTANANFVGEAYLQDDSTIGVPTTVALGNLFNPGVGTQDLEFFYRTSDGSIIEGIVSYSSSSTPGDFDGDGDVDGADFLTWQVGFPTAPHDAAGYALWESNYGFGSGPGNGSLSGSAVPEPSTIVLFGLVSLIGLVATKRRR